MALITGAILSGCAGGLNSGAGKSWMLDNISPNTPEIETRLLGDDVELKLEPLGVWWQQDIPSQQVVLDENTVVNVRVHSAASWLEAPHTRVGLFWRSDQDTIVLPIVIEQRQPIKIRGGEIHADSYSATLQIAKNFTFNPSSSDSELILSKASFILPEEALLAMRDSQTAILLLKTHRGDLSLGLDITRGNSAAHVRKNARYMFSAFADEIVTIKNNL